MSDASKYKGRCYIEMGIPNLALIAFKKAIENDEKNAELYSKFLNVRLLRIMLLALGVRIMGRCTPILRQSYSTRQILRKILLQLSSGQSKTRSV